LSDVSDVSDGSDGSDGSDYQSVLVCVCAYCFTRSAFKFTEMAPPNGVA